MHRYKELKFWQFSRTFCKDIYTITATFPSDEKFGLVSQLRRASVSVASNIAEGTSRKSTKDFSRFLTVALGSCYEIETQLIISNDLGFISNNENEILLEKLITIIKMMSKFKATLS